MGEKTLSLCPCANAIFNQMMEMMTTTIPMMIMMMKMMSITIAKLMITTSSQGRCSQSSSLTNSALRFFLKFMTQRIASILRFFIIFTTRRISGITKFSRDCEGLRGLSDVFLLLQIHISAGMWIRSVFNAF